MKRDQLLLEIEKEFGYGCAVICNERARQKEVKGYDIKRDAHLYKEEELAKAAFTYTLNPKNPLLEELKIKDRASNFWPWSLEYWNPTPNNRKREFEKAGALLAAQIDVEYYK